MTKTVKLNYKNDPSNKKKMWMCDDCTSVDSQEHILWCPAYGHLRLEKNLEDDRDLTRYFQQEDSPTKRQVDDMVMQDDCTWHTTLLSQ